MSRLMSVAMTADAVIERRKTVTRRKGWWEDRNGRRIIKPGDTLTLCRKVQGRKPGEPIERLVGDRAKFLAAEVEVVSVVREVTLEGFAEMGRTEFLNAFFVEAQGIFPHEDVTRIEWRYVDEVAS